jgi:hypothetical protein
MFGLSTVIQAQCVSVNGTVKPDLTTTCEQGTKQTLQKKTVGFLLWEIIKKPWDF